MKKHLKTAMIAAAVLAVGAAGAFTVPKFTADKTIEQTVAKSGVTVHYKWNSDETPHFYYTSVNGKEVSMSYPGVPMNQEAEGWYSYTVADAKDLKFQVILDNTDFQTASISCEAGEYWFDEDRFVKNATQDYLEATGGLETAKEAKSMIAQTMRAMTVKKMENSKESITIHYASDWNDVKLYAWNALPNDVDFSWPGKTLEKDSDGYYSYTFNGVSKVNFLFGNGTEQSEEFTLNKAGEYTYKNGKWVAGGNTPSTDTPASAKPTPAPFERTDFRDETIYFVMTTRFYDGDSSNNSYCWDDEKLKSVANNDPGWRGDFKGLAEKLDYIKALGFSAVWITPVAQNASGLDYHGYHANNFKKVDPRYESSDFTYQDLINAAHEKGIKIIQDIVLNHTSNFGEENLFPIMEKDPNADPADIEACMKVKDPKGIMPSQEEYDAMEGEEQYGARLAALKGDDKDTDFIYHHTSQTEWEQYSVQTGSVAGDCVDLDTENPIVSDYLIDAYNGYINMGVDAFRVDTVKHISRLTFNKEFIPAFKKTGGNNFYIFGECCCLVADKTNKGIPCITPFFYTWKESKEYPWGDRLERAASTEQNWKDNESGEKENAMRTSDNAFLNGNEYHKPDYSQSSGFDMIDFRMHHNFLNASRAFSVAKESDDDVYNDATWNVTYVDSHDYGPNECLNNRYKGGTQAWAENLNLMFTHRGIPCIYYGSEIEFMAGAQIDPRYNNSWVPYKESGRAYFGDHIEGSVNCTDYAVYNNATGAMAETLNYPLAKHIQRLNLIRRAVPALCKGQYSTKDVSGGGMSYRRRYTADGEDSYVLVNLSGSATFKNVLNGEYVELVTGKSVSVGDGTLTTENVEAGNMRVYVLQNDTAKKYGANGKVGADGEYLK